MKNRKNVFVAIIIAAASLAACGTIADRDVTSGEMAVPEVSSEDLLVSSLEYLLLDDDAPDSEEQDLSDQNVEEQAEQNTAEESEDITGEQSEPAEDDIQGEEAVVYYGDGGLVALQQETIELEAVTPEELIGTLARHNIVSLDTKVLSFEQGEEAEATVLHLDLSKAVNDYLGTMSKEAECIIVAAIVDTFLENYDSDAIYLTVEGNPLVTSNAEYTEKIERCTPEELLKALDAPAVDDSADNMQHKLPLTAVKE